MTTGHCVEALEFLTEGAYALSSNTLTCVLQSHGTREIESLLACHVLLLTAVRMRRTCNKAHGWGDWQCARGGLGGVGMHDSLRLENINIKFK